MTEKLQWLISALGLVLVFEGLLPLAIPNIWRRNMERLLILPNSYLRFSGLVLMLLGALIIWYLHI